MKRILVLSVFAIGMLATTQQEASAWVKTRFGVGLNWDYQSGGNTLLWGLWRNSQPPGPDGFAPHGHPHFGVSPYFGGQPQFGVPAGFAPGAFQPTPQGFPPQGFLPQGPMLPQTGPVMPSALVPQGVNTPVSYQGSPFQFANYPRPMYYYYSPYAYNN